MGSKFFLAFFLSVIAYTPILILGSFSTRHWDFMHRSVSNILSNDKRFCSFEGQVAEFQHTSTEKKIWPMKMCSSRHRPTVNLVAKTPHHSHVCTCNRAFA